MSPVSTEVQVERVTKGLPESLRELVRRESAVAAGHNDNSRACYDGNCSHDADVAEAMVKAFRLGATGCTCGRPLYQEHRQDCQVNGAVLTIAAETLRLSFGRYSDNGLKLTIIEGGRQVAHLLVPVKKPFSPGDLLRAIHRARRTSLAAEAALGGDAE